EHLADALARVVAPHGLDARAEGPCIVVDGPAVDPFETGRYVGQLVVALRAEGYAAAVRRTGDGAVLEVSAATAYQGLPR
uniref:hypothetical protein n=1 Tax=Cumulibacter manganitolerans TaxID=1884992 RepID=UPI00188615B4